MQPTQSQLSKLEFIYRSYGFDVAGKYDEGKVYVFTIKNGYFDNADIVALDQSANTDDSFNQYTSLGYACSRKEFKSLKEVEDQLFKGFFSVQTIIDRLLANYERFTSSLVKPFSPDATYKYINAQYLVNGKPGQSSPYEEVVARLDEQKPILFLIEAAAGFGKTCTAYELVKNIVTRTDYLPFFAELSRNREARIFRYILLDEIDRTFPVLSSRLVKAEITNGRVITILDGFDELLRNNDDGEEFENREPMLETIGEFLTNNAKIVLTTRRTVLFEGDAFHEWVEKHTDEFELVTIKLSEPRVTDWLSADKLEALKRTPLNIDDISNPVLLSYLRCIPDEKYYEALENPNSIVNSYFDFMLEREKQRQDLRLDTTKQKIILRGISEDMINYGYTSEYRDYIVDHILRNNNSLLEESIKNYSVSEKPTKEEVANKLASHALLDRNSSEPNKIGFINEFVLGNFVAENILSAPEWLNDDLRFIEPAVLSYQPRTVDQKMQLLTAIKGSLDYLSCTQKLNVFIKLQKSINYDLNDNEAENIEFDTIDFLNYKVWNFQFNECVFKNCKFNISNFSNVTFLNCRFYGNEVLGSPFGSIYVLGASGDEGITTQLSVNIGENQIEDAEVDRDRLAEAHILEKFWPTGRGIVSHKHRPIKALCKGTQILKPYELYDAITRLRRRNILLEPKSVHFVEINFSAINEIREILGRDLDIQ